MDNFPKYRRSAIPDVDLIASKKNAYKLYGNSLSMMAEDLRNKEFVSFTLPPNGEIIKYNASTTLSTKDLHLPFTHCAIEYTCTREFYSEVPAEKAATIPKAAIIMATESDEDIFFYAIWKFSTDNGDRWAPFGGALHFKRDATIEIMSDGKVKAGPLTQITFNKDNNILDFMSDLAEELRVVTHFAALCACDNVKAEKIYTPSEALVKKSISRGNLPPDDYWTLDVCLNKTPSDSYGVTGGHHTSPRLHIRRGHVRRLPTGKTTWVKQHTVGDADLGIIDKDYRIKIA